MFNMSQFMFQNCNKTCITINMGVFSHSFKYNLSEKCMDNDFTLSTTPPSVAIFLKTASAMGDLQIFPVQNQKHSCLKIQIILKSYIINYKLIIELFIYCMSIFFMLYKILYTFFQPFQDNAPYCLLKRNQWQIYVLFVHHYHLESHQNSTANITIFLWCLYLLS